MTQNSFWSKLLRSQSDEAITEEELRSIRNWVAAAEWLNGSTRKLMIRWSRRFIASKHWEGCEGFQITPDVQNAVAWNASLLVLAYPDWIFPSTKSILIYPRPYRARSAGGDLHHGLGGTYLRAGETRARGPVVLNWRDIQRAITDPLAKSNIVIHEFAHQLDMANDPQPDGLPPLPKGVDAQRWKDAFHREFQECREAVERGEEISIDDYGLTHPSEFFAVASECYFQDPQELREYHASLYNLLRDFYVTDVAAAMEHP